MERVALSLPIVSSEDRLLELLSKCESVRDIKGLHVTLLIIDEDQSERSHDELAFALEFSHAFDVYVKFNIVTPD